LDLFAPVVCTGWDRRPDNGRTANMLRMSRIAAVTAGVAVLGLGASPALATNSTPTSLTLHSNRTDVPHGQKVTLTGLLKAGSKPLAGKSVQLERRAYGTKTFTVVSTKTTDSKGHVTATVVPGTRKGQKTQYELVYAGDSGYKGSHSSTITITVT
jgi:pyruvate/oxaloacetate carboxyltransferase